MALAVASTSTASGNNAASITVTAPTGITTGDLLLFIVSGHDAVTTPTDFSIGDSYQYTGPVTNASTTVAIYYKIAVLADESATDYTATFDSSDGGGAACMLRVTGWNIGNPVYDSIKNTNRGIASTGETSGTLSVGGTLSRPAGQLLIMTYTVGTTDNSITFTYSNQTVTSSDSNPTWTEVIEDVYFCNSGTDTASKALGVAYAITTDTSDITVASVDYVEGSGNGMGATVACFSLVEPTNASGTAGLLEPTTTLFSGNAQADASGTTALLEPTTSFPAPTSIVSSPSEWTNESDSSTSWTNESQP